MTPDRRAANTVALLAQIDEPPLTMAWREQAIVKVAAAIREAEAELEARWTTQIDDFVRRLESDHEHAIREAVLAEREACAEIADRMTNAIVGAYTPASVMDMAIGIRDAIRASNKES